MNVRTAVPTLHMPHMLSAPKLSTPKAPKLAAIKVKQMKNATGGMGMHVSHYMTNGAVHKFFFADPNKVGAHLIKASRAQWREPGKDPAPGILHDIGEPAG